MKRPVVGAVLFLLGLAACGERRVASGDGAPAPRWDAMAVDPTLTDLSRPATDQPPRRDTSRRDLQHDSRADLTLKLDHSFPVKDGAQITSAVDILFVIDNSVTMEAEQSQLAAQIPALIDALKLGGSLPDLHLGVVSTDLGAGNYALPSCEVAGGDGGKLQSAPRVAGCAPPSDPWISHAGGLTNVPSGAADPAARVKEAFACIAPLGVGGCGFEQPLEAARRALDPVANVNPGFLRPNALLAVVFVTDEDDCSAAKTALYDPNGTALGPLASYRCTQFGYACNEPLATPGSKSGCAPGGSYLSSVASYVSFFQGLKPAGKVFLAAIAGPASPIDVAQVGSNLELKPSCSSIHGSGAPGLRLQAVLDGMASNGDTGLFDLGIDPQNKPVAVNICSADYAPVMRLLGLKLAGAI